MGYEKCVPKIHSVILEPANNLRIFNYHLFTAMVVHKLPHSFRMRYKRVNLLEF